MVVDASAFVEALIELRPAGVVDLDSVELSAPSLVDAEVLSSARRLAQASPSRVSSITAGMVEFMELSIDRHDSTQFLPRMWSLRDNLSAYDASYVALAESLEVPLLTADRGLARAATQYCEVILYR